MLLIIFLSGCASGMLQDKELMIQNSHYYRNNPKNETVIIFVHGVSGDSTSTWENTNGSYWPELLKNDPDFDKANIYMINYSSPAIAKAYSINELAECMRRDFQSDKVLNHCKIIFLAHSMGGLLTREFLLKYREYTDKVSFLYFFATPTSGSSIATIIKFLSKNPQYGKMVPLRSDDSLADIQRNWLASEQMTRIPSYGSYEAKDTLGLRIVEQESATHLCNRSVSPINKNHIDIVKPKDINDESYRAFKAAYIDSSKVTSVSYLASENLVRELMVQLEGNDKIRALLEQIISKRQIPNLTYSDMPTQVSTEISPLIKFSHQEFIDNFSAFYAYNLYRKKLQLLNPDKLVELLYVYFRSVLLYPSNDMTQYYITASDGRLLRLEMKGHNEKGETISISLPNISGTLLADVCTDFIKSAQPKHYEMIVNLFDRALSTSELDKVHKINIMDAKNDILKYKLLNNIGNTS